MQRIIGSRRHSFFPLEELQVPQSKQVFPFIAAVFCRYGSLWTFWAKGLILGGRILKYSFLVAACAVLLLDLFLPQRLRRFLHWGVIGVCLVAAIIAASGFGDTPALALNGFFVANPLTALMKTAVMLAVGGSLFFSRRYLVAAGMYCGEYYALALTSALGMLVMISAAHLLPLYIGLELMSLSLYAMIALDRDNKRAAESAIKYFVLGALASGLFLYGVSVIYGATGELGILQVAAAISNDSGGDQIAAREKQTTADCKHHGGFHQCG